MVQMVQLAQTLLQEAPEQGLLLVQSVQGWP